MTKLFERLSSLALALVLAFGVLAAWFFATVMTLGPVWGKYSQNKYESLTVLRDGMPVIRSIADPNYGFRTLDGKMLPNLDEGREIWRGDQLSGPKWKESQFKRPDWQKRVKPVYGFDLARETEKWYFIQNGRLDGRGYFVGYDLKSRLCVGYISRNGFLNIKPPEDEQFRVDGRRAGNQITNRIRFQKFVDSPDAPEPFPSYYTNLLSNDGLYEICPSQRSVKLLFSDANLCSAATTIEAKELSRLRRETPAPQLLVARTPDRVILLDDAGKQVRSYLLPPDIRDEYFQWYELGDGKAMITINRNAPRVDGERRTSLIFWLEDEGRVVRHREVALQTKKGISEELLWMLFAPSPPVNILFLFSNVADDGMEPSLIFWKTVENDWPWLATLAIVCIILAWLCYRRQRRFGLPWTWMWVCFVLLLGVPGWLGYLAHRRWPARLPCPNCGQPAPRDRPACLYCGHDFPAPELTGAEVFA